MPTFYSRPSTAQTCGTYSAWVLLFVSPPLLSGRLAKKTIRQSNNQTMQIWTDTTLAKVDSQFVSFTRLEVHMRADASSGFREILQHLQKHNLQDQSGIIYCMTCKEAEALAQYLRDSGLSANFYHGELPNSERATRQNQWMAGILKCVCTTIAFGLGIDKPDVRYVVHATMPQSLEAYYQQIGRAGRDALRSDCVMFWHPRDAQRVTNIVRSFATQSAIATRSSHSGHAPPVPMRRKFRPTNMEDLSERVVTEEEREYELDAKLSQASSLRDAEEERTVLFSEDGQQMDLEMAVR